MVPPTTGIPPGRRWVRRFRSRLNAHRGLHHRYERRASCKSIRPSSHTRVASEQRGGGWVKCCSGLQAEQAKGGDSGELCPASDLRIEPGRHSIGPFVIPQNRIWAFKRVGKPLRPMRALIQPQKTEASVRKPRCNLGVSPCFDGSVGGENLAHAAETVCEGEGAGGCRWGGAPHGAGHDGTAATRCVGAQADLLDRPARRTPQGNRAAFANRHAFLHGREAIGIPRATSIGLGHAGSANERVYAHDRVARPGVKWKRASRRGGPTRVVACVRASVGAANACVRASVGVANLTGAIEFRRRGTGAHRLALSGGEAEALIVAAARVEAVESGGRAGLINDATPAPLPACYAADASIARGGTADYARAALAALRVVLAAARRQNSCVGRRCRGVATAIGAEEVATAFTRSAWTATAERCAALAAERRCAAAHRCAIGAPVACLAKGSRAPASKRRQDKNGQDLGGCVCCGPLRGSFWWLRSQPNAQGVDLRRTSQKAEARPRRAQAWSNCLHRRSP